MAYALRPRFSIAALREIWADNRLTNRQVGAAIGRTERGLQDIAVRLGLPPRKLGPKVKLDQRLFARMYLAGVSMAEIAVFTGMHRSSLPYVAVRLGLASRGKGWVATMTLAQFWEAELGRAMAETAVAERAAHAARAQFIRAGTGGV